ncbi:hypothetical protein RVR_480 [Actinacidiphila reveromycinica]|uniref:Nucleoside diphosphate kinase-like domain-containing protein n=1 Tax=Actinacidiphila reveromycinica TaxID=659352 RepID=A0A7U3UN14_9ACTN|nr:hypothetical protein [Streptomyces sp. SN-593]BBA95571.1 hypothetical protein RVR_480 [Streptomyces sp. SN-593]
MGDGELGRNVGLFVLMPDAMVVDAWDALAERLAPLRLDVLATTALMLRPPTLAALYAHGTFKKPPAAGRRPGAWLSYELGALDMAIPAVVRTPYDVDLPGLFDAWKGGSSHDGRRAGDLRAVSPAAQRCFSVLHTPDDAAQTALDVRTLFGEATAAAVGGADAVARCSVADLRRLRMPGIPRGGSEPYGMVRGCAARAAALLAYDHLLAPSRPWSRFADRCASAAGSAEPWSVAVAGLAAELPPAPRPAGPGTMAGTRPRAALHDALAALLDPASYRPETSQVVERAFDDNDLFLDGWERHMLRVALSFHTV